MSLSSTLTSAINSTIKKFISSIAETYRLDEDELISIWEGGQTPSVSAPKKQVNNTVVIHTENATEHSQLLKATKTELVAMCKKYGHKCSGTKEELISRLLGNDNKEKKSSSPDAKTETKGKSKASSKEPAKQSEIIKKLTANIPNIIIKRNKFNNYEHSETSLVFDNDTKVVIGKQKADGSLEELTEDDIDKCNAYKFVYKMPKNLDSKATLADVKVAELDEEDNNEEQSASKQEEEDVEEEELLGEDDFEEEELLEDNEEEEDE